MARESHSAAVRPRPVVVACIVVTLCGCRTDDRPARIVDPTPESRAELKQAVSAALNGADVRLADDALTRESVLVIEPNAARDAQNNRIMGRVLAKPIQFVLLTHDGDCVLESRDSGERWPLPHTRCLAE